MDAATPAASAGPPTAGAKLRAAREAAGLSLDAVARQLKLAPRQVKALEDDDWSRLPGRTFVRGFARNYARFVRLDPDGVLALLPSADIAPSLERPPLAASRRPMGEIPVERMAKPSAARWLFPLLLLAIIAAIAFHELSPWPLSLPLRWPDFTFADEPTADSASGATPPQKAATVTSALPNPASDAPPPPAPVEATEAKDAAMSAPTIGAPPVTPAATTAASATPSAAVAPGVSGASAGVPAGEAALVLTFRGTSWAEVKDGKGRVVLQMTGGAGMTQTVSAAPPLELALGNAPNVGVTFRGRSLDLAPYTRGNVARVALK